MKNVLLVATLLLVTVANSFASDTKVNKAVLKNFTSNYQSAKNVTWKSTNDYQKASFELANQKMEVFYTPTGEFIATSTELTFNDLPLHIQKNIKKFAEGYEVTETILYSCPDEDCYYVAMSNDKNNLVLKVSDNGQVSKFKSSKR